MLLNGMVVMLNVWHACVSNPRKHHVLVKMARPLLIAAVVVSYLRYKRGTSRLTCMTLLSIRLLKLALVCFVIGMTVKLIANVMRRLFTLSINVVITLFFVGGRRCEVMEGGY